GKGTWLSRPALLIFSSRSHAGHNRPVPASAEGAAMSSEVDRAERFITIQRQIIAIFTGDAPAADELGRDRYFFLIAEEARLGEEAGQAKGDPGASGAEDRTA